MVVRNSDEETYQKNRDVILTRAKDYYKDDKERLREEARDKYRMLSEEEKNKKQKYGRNRYHNMSEEKKQSDWTQTQNHLGLKQTHNHLAKLARKQKKKKEKETKKQRLQKTKRISNKLP